MKPRHVSSRGVSTLTGRLPASFLSTLLMPSRHNATPSALDNGRLIRKSLSLASLILSRLHRNIAQRILGQSKNDLLLWDHTPTPQRPHAAGVICGDGMEIVANQHTLPLSNGPPGARLCSTLVHKVPQKYESTGVSGVGRSSNGLEGV